jgi:hypothetical protein
VARAKRTDRAEARRRYRAATAPEPIDGATDTDGDAANQPRSSAGASSSSAARPTGTPTGSGMAWAFKAAFRPVHVRQDIESVPWIAIHTKALWVPVLITLASTVLVAVTGGKDTLSAFVYQYFILTPAIGGVFIAGFLAPRASWLLGVIVGVVAAACYSFLGLSGVVPVGATVSAVDVVVTSFVLSPLIGAFFAAAAAWYRRFLALSNPNRRRQPAKGPVAKKGDGRTRSGGTSQKAGVRR